MAINKTRKNACVYFMNKKKSPDLINIGTGSYISIICLVELIKNVIVFQRKFVFDTSKPDGTPRKILDTHRLLDTNWKPLICLKEGLKITYEEFKKSF